MSMGLQHQMQFWPQRQAQVHLYGIPYKCVRNSVQIADRPGIKDILLQFKSKNERTDFTDGHIGASFKNLVVSDIPISMPNKQVENYYTYQTIYKGLDANDEFVKQIQMIENILI